MIFFNFEYKERKKWTTYRSIPNHKVLSPRNDRMFKLLMTAKESKNTDGIELSKLREILKNPVENMSDLEKWVLFLKYIDDKEYREKMNEIIGSKEELETTGNMLLKVSTNEDERKGITYIALEMINANMSTETIMNLTKLSRDEIVSLQQKLKENPDLLRTLAENHMSSLEDTEIKEP